MTLAANVNDHSEIIAEPHKHINHEKLNIGLTLIASILAGPILFSLLSSTNANFAQTEKGLTFLALTAIAFELTWIIYGFAALIHKAIQEN